MFLSIFRKKKINFNVTSWENWLLFGCGRVVLAENFHN